MSWMKVVALTFALGGLAPALTGTAHAQDVTKLKINLYTDQDDKDDDETVTIEIIRVSDGHVIASDTYGSGETWKDQSEKQVDLRLKEALPIKDKGKYKVKISKSCAKGYPNGKGWHFCVRAIDGVTDDSQLYKLRGKETSRILLGKHGGETEPTSVEWDLAD